MVEKGRLLDPDEQSSQIQVDSRVESRMLKGGIVTQRMVCAFSNQTPPNNSWIDVEPPTELAVPLLHLLAFNRGSPNSTTLQLLLFLITSITYKIGTLDMLTTLTN